MMSRSGSIECNILHLWWFGIEGLDEAEKVHLVLAYGRLNFDTNRLYRKRR
jgi:hypothetical protein